MITDEEIDVLGNRCGIWVVPEERLREFARLIEQRARREEREACAKVCEDEADFRRSGKPRLYEFGLLCAKLIRARGEA